MRVSQRDRFTAAFVVTAEDLGELVAKIRHRLPDIKFEAACADKLNREFENLQDLCDYSNPKGREIRELTISATKPDDFRSRFALELSSDESSANVVMSLQAEEDVAVALNHNVREQLRAMRPWYHLVTRLGWGVLAFAMPMLYCLYVLASALVQLVACNDGINTVMMLFQGHGYLRDCLDLRRTGGVEPAPCFAKAAGG